jgi:hypothetical protein
MLVPLFLYGMVKTQAVDLSGPEAAEAGEGCFGVWEQMQLHGRVRTDHNGAVADAQVDPVAGEYLVAGRFGTRSASPGGRDDEMAPAEPCGASGWP